MHGSHSCPTPRRISSIALGTRPSTHGMTILLYKTNIAANYWLLHDGPRSGVLLCRVEEILTKQSWIPAHACRNCWIPSNPESVPISNSEPRGVTVLTYRRAVAASSVDANDGPTTSHVRPAWLQLNTIFNFGPCGSEPYPPVHQNEASLPAAWLRDPVCVRSRHTTCTQLVAPQLTCLVKHQPSPDQHSPQHHQPTAST